MSRANHQDRVKLGAGEAVYSCDCGHRDCRLKIVMPVEEIRKLGTGQLIILRGCNSADNFGVDSNASQWFIVPRPGWMPAQKTR